jgi:AraC-like DNA-binding protein
MKLQNENLTRMVMQQDDYEVFFFDGYYKQDVPLHCHSDFYEIYCFLAGDLSYLMGSMEYKMVPGTVLLIPPGILHQPIFKQKDTPYIRMFIWLNRYYLQQLSSNKTNLCSCFEKDEYKKMARLDIETLQHLQSKFLRLVRLKNSNIWGADLLANSIITDILLTVHSVCQEKSVDSDSIQQDTFLSLVIAYINDNIESIWTLDQIANYFYVSKSYLIQQFTMKLGISPYKYIIKKRMSCAYQLLLKGFPLNNIYTQVGYRDYPTFYKAFRKEYGFKPTALIQKRNEYTSL